MIKNNKEIITIVLLGIMVVIIISYMYKYNDTNNIDSFLIKSETGRALQYGDVIMLWTQKNSFVQRINANTIETGIVYTSPDSFIMNTPYTYFTIQNSLAPNNTGPVMYSDKIQLLTWEFDYLSSDDIKYMYTVGPVTSPNTLFEFVNIENNDATDVIKYGDNVLIKSANSNYLSASIGNNNNIVQIKTPDISSRIIITDKYGHGTIVDWAKHGVATQSTSLIGAAASSAIDGNINSFSETTREKTPWWQVKLPKDIYVTTIHIGNRRGCCQKWLANFDIILLDNKGIVTKSIYQKDFAQDYNIENIDTVARTIKVMLRDTNYLTMSEFNVYGESTVYSQLLEKPISVDLINNKIIINNDNPVKIINNVDIPYIGKANGMSVSFMLRVGNLENMNILSKNAAPQIIIDDNKLFVGIQTTNKKELIITNYEMKLNIWTHITLIISSKIDITTGWIYGQIKNNYYYMNRDLKQIYKTSKINMLTTIPEWNADVLTKNVYMGIISANNNTNSVKVIINGVVIANQILQNLPVFNTSDLYIGAVPFTSSTPAIDEGFTTEDNVYNVIMTSQMETKAKQANIELEKRNATNSLLAKQQMQNTLMQNAAMMKKGLGVIPEKYSFELNKLKIYNYAITPNQIQHDYSYANMIFDLYRGKSSGKLSFEPNEMPIIRDTYSMNFWFLAGSGIIYNHDTRILGISPNNTLYIKDGSVNYNLNCIVSKDTWYNYTEINSSGITAILIDRKLINELPIKYLNKFKHTVLNVNALIYNFKYANYDFNNEEIISINDVHPEHFLRGRINEQWAKLGCPEPLNDQYLNLLLVNAKIMSADNFTKLLIEIKSQKENKKVCYGAFAGDLLTEYNRHKDLLTNVITQSTTSQGQSSLPVLPTGDFDISRHTDFKNVVSPDYLELEKLKQANKLIDDEKKKLMSFNKEIIKERDALKSKINIGNVSIMTAANKQADSNIITNKSILSTDLDYVRLMNNIKEMNAAGHKLEGIMNMLNSITLEDITSKNYKYQAFKSKVLYYYNIQKFANGMTL